MRMILLFFYLLFYYGIIIRLLPIAPPFASTRTSLLSYKSTGLANINHDLRPLRSSHIQRVNTVETHIACVCAYICACECFWVWPAIIHTLASCCFELPRCRPFNQQRRIVKSRKYISANNDVVVDVFMAWTPNHPSETRWP